MVILFWNSEVGRNASLVDHSVTLRHIYILHSKHRSAPISVKLGGGGNWNDIFCWGRYSVRRQRKPLLIQPTVR